MFAEEQAAALAAAGAASPADLTDIEEIGQRHNAAVMAGQPSYVDPKSGYKVFTAETLKQRGRCCGCGCRHCPYNNKNVAPEKKAARSSQPTLLVGSFDGLAAADVDVLFWSGGKDSYLAARALCRERGTTRHLVLLTTFDGRCRQVAHQEVPIADVMRQVDALGGVPLVGVPVFSHIPCEHRRDRTSNCASSAGSKRRSRV